MTTASVSEPDPLAELEELSRRPVLDLAGLDRPLRLESVETLRIDGVHALRIRDDQGGSGLAFPGEAKFPFLIELMRKRLLPVLLGRDLREWESLHEEVYRALSNYKLQGLAFWMPFAALEFAVLDLLGHYLGKPIGALLGERRCDGVAVYQAFHDRSLPAQQLALEIERRLAETGARAVKFKLGGRMSRDADCLPGRSEELPGLLRGKLGADMTLYGDANGSYRPAEAIRIGRILEEAGVAFFEEPCPFDHFEDTLTVARALDIDIAGGEQDSSHYNLLWLLARGGLQVVQPDLFYGGGMVRARRIARAAEAVGATCAPHISGDGLGSLYMAHFVSALPNAAPFHEYKDEPIIPASFLDGSPVRAREGRFPVPDAPGLGIEIDPDWLARAERLSFDSA